MSVPEGGGGDEGGRGDRARAWAPLFSPEDMVLKVQVLVNYLIN